VAISCDPATIVAAAKCFECIPREMQWRVLLYLAFKTAGLGTDTATIQSTVAAAKCMICVPDEMREPLLLYLLAQIAGCT
jgi:hypothetical protein